MTTLQQLKQKKIEKFEERWQDPMEKKHGKGFKLYCSFCQGEWRDEIKSFLSSAMDEIQNATIEAAQVEIWKMKENGKIRSSVTWDSAISNSHSALNNLKNK